LWRRVQAALTGKGSPATESRHWRSIRECRPATRDRTLRFQLILRSLDEHDRHAHSLARPDDAERQLKLDRMKRRATGLLVVATVVFVVARIFEHNFPWVAYIRATAEAAMVGGLADWFAVTALFKHPLGLPIPHTAIVA